VRVLDFGITQLADTTGAHALTATHTVMGTAEYLAPEQALGGRVDGRADLYALGCVLYALLVGQPPFRGATPVATMMMHANDPVPDLREARPDTPSWLVGLIDGLLAKSPEDRPAGAGVVVSSLATHEAPVLAPTARMEPLPPAPPAPLPVTPPPAPQAQARGTSWPLVVLAVVAVVALALLGWNLFAQNTADPESSPTPSVSEVVTTAPPTTEAAPTTAAPTPTPTPTPTEDPAQAVTDAVDALSSEIGVMESDRTIDKKTAKDLDDGLSDLSKALDSGDAAEVTTATDDFVTTYDAAVNDGSIPPEAADQLDPLVQDLLDAVDTYAS